MNSFAIVTFILLGLTGLLTLASVVFEFYRDSIDVEKLDSIQPTVQHLAYFTGIATLTFGFFSSSKTPAA